MSVDAKGQTPVTAKVEPVNGPQDEKFVVLKTLGNPAQGTPFEPGQVVKASQLSPDQTKAPPIEHIQRLVKIGAIVPALDHEKDHAHVDIKSRLAPGKGLIETNTELQNKVAKLQTRLEELSAEHESLKQQKSDQFDPHKDQLTIELRQADQEKIIQLEQSNKDKDEIISSLNKKLNAPKGNR